MKVYFAGSIRGGREDAALYQEMITIIKEKHEVLTEHVGDLDKSAFESGGKDALIYESDMAMLRACDMVVAECTSVSCGVGYEIGYGDALGKVIHVFYNEDRVNLSAMLKGNKNLFLHPYKTADQAFKQLEEII